jgi:RHS repeat-associated protein
MTASSSKTYAYNAMGLMTSANNGQIGAYWYDALGRQVKKTYTYSDQWGQHSGTTKFVYGINGEILTEYKTGNHPFGAEDSVTNNVVLGGQIISQRTTGTKNGAPVNDAMPLRRNHLGEVITWSVTHTAYPPPFGSGGSDQFPGQKANDETGLNDFGARNYIPGLVRWMSADPLTAKIYDPQSLVSLRQACVISSGGTGPSPAPSLSYDAFGRQVKKTYNYSDMRGQHTGTTKFVYGINGEILVEYKTGTHPSGDEDSVTNNVVLGGQIISQRTTGTKNGAPVNDAIPLRRNHLGEVITLNYGIPTAYQQPFNSGGSDQFPGEKVNEETGLSNFGARNYRPTHARWMSPDSITGHAYDPQSLNKYTYVRNDPVNLVDPDGRSVFSFLGGIFGKIGSSITNWYWYEPETSGFSDPYMLPYLIFVANQELAGFPDFFANAMDQNAGGGIGGVFKLSDDKAKQARTIALSGDCKSFLEGLIKRLDGKLSNAFSIDQLLKNLSKADFQNVESLGPGHYEHVDGNTIQMAATAYSNHYYNYGTGDIQSRPGDEFTVYLHATFHLAMSSADGKTNITDQELYQSLGSQWQIPVNDSLKGAIVGLAFATNCGPNAVPR